MMSNVSPRAGSVWLQLEGGGTQQQEDTSSEPDGTKLRKRGREVQFQRTAALIDPTLTLSPLYDKKQQSGAVASTAGSGTRSQHDARCRFYR